MMRKPLEQKNVITGFYLPGVLVLGLAEFFGMILSAYVTESVLYIVCFSIAIMAGLILAYFLSTLALKYLLKSFENETKANLCAQLLALPLVLGYLPIAVMVLFRSMFFLGLLSFYAVYLFWAGTQKIPGIHKEKISLFGILAVIFTVGIHLLILFLVLSLKTPFMTWV
ncbi:MAG: hypothetical protein PF590_04290 [Candidatus Delongbacteria bacterium]|nr:hypothetical protein [Candidatus Delongbacteria bacterium]